MFRWKGVVAVVSYFFSLCRTGTEYRYRSAAITLWPNRGVGATFPTAVTAAVALSALHTVPLCRCSSGSWRHNAAVGVSEQGKGGGGGAVHLWYCAPHLGLGHRAVSACSSRRAWCSLHSTSQGNELHWLACALYVACRKAIPTVSRGTVEGNYVSLTRILRCSEQR